MLFFKADICVYCLVWWS